MPNILVGRHPLTIAAFWRHYNAAVDRERSLPVEQRFITRRGPNETAIGYVLYRDARERKTNG